MIMNIKQKKIKIEPRIKLNHKIYIQSLLQLESAPHPTPYPLLDRDNAVIQRCEEKILFKVLT